MMEFSMKTFIGLSITVILAGCFCSCSLHPGASVPTASSVGPIDLSAVPDGTFRGNYRKAKIDYQVDVTVEAKTIRDIRIIKTKEQFFGKKCALCEVEYLIQEILSQQTLPVDAVSGATQTSHAILKAIEDALRPPFRVGSGR
jgi:fumarate reductase flavoprotein subunit